MGLNYGRAFLEEIIKIHKPKLIFSALIFGTLMINIPSMKMSQLLTIPEPIILFIN